MRLKNEIGNRYGRLTVIARAENCKQGQARWICKCDCGSICVVSGSNLRRGKQVSCGCYGKTIRAKNDVPTELRQGRIYRIWQRMIYRCTNSNSIRYSSYGGRGITVCEEWLNDYMSFHKWALSTGYQDSLSIDRIDVNGNYEPSNCRWATTKEQACNKQNTINVTYKGQTKCIAEWCRLFGLKPSTVYLRASSGWTNPEEILFGKKRKVGNVYG